MNLWVDGLYLPLLICGGECLEWSERSDRLSGERERLLRCLSCDRLEWSDAKEWISEMSDQTRATVEWLQTEIWYEKLTCETRPCVSQIHPSHRLCQRRWLKECCHRGRGCLAGSPCHPSERPFLACPSTFLSASWHLSRRGSLSLCHWSERNQQKKPLKKTANDFS